MYVLGFLRRSLLPAAVCCALPWLATPLEAACVIEFVDPNPSVGNQFGASVVTLSTGNVVITSPFDDGGAADAGAVYLFNGSTGALISVLRGASPNDRIGSGGVTALPSGNFVVISPLFDTGGFTDAGAVTWVRGTTGLNGLVSPANSLVGFSPNDQIGSYGVTVLANGNYVVSSPSFDGLGGSDTGAATWGNGTTGVTGSVGAANSLVGPAAGDQIGSEGITALTNGNYVVCSSLWNNVSLFLTDAGAATWGNGTTGTIGNVSAANSLTGSKNDDRVGSFGATALSNGNYVVISPSWDNGPTLNPGAVTWGNGATGTSGAVSPANSLVGSGFTNNVGSGGVTALTNGNYVVCSPSWPNGGMTAAGAVTWANGATGLVGFVSAANSLVGSNTNDLVGSYGARALTNGNYVVPSPDWNNGAVADAGAVTWGNGTTGITGVISAANSLVGTVASDFVGNGDVRPLTNGNYVVVSYQWNNGAVVDAGAATWGSGTSGVTGAVSAANSLVGSAPSDLFGSVSIALSNGNYVVRCPLWNQGGIVDAGAATWGNGTTGVTGVISAANSLVGSATNDRIGSAGIALTNGHYVIGSTLWDNGVVADAGAVCWGNGTTGTIGVVSAANSLVGSSFNDFVGWGGLTPLTNGHYVVGSPIWNNGTLVDAGAATWGNGTVGVTGPVSAANSVMGGSASASLQAFIAEGPVNGSFIARFLGEGRVRVGPLDFPAAITSALDVPNDQGGWLRLTFDRSCADEVASRLPVASYNVWRHLPGTLIASMDLEPSTQAFDSRAAETRAQRLRSELPADFDVRESGGRLFVTAPISRTEGTFPAGTWELVTSLAAAQQPTYIVAVPTISNAASNDYFVSAHTSNPAVWFASNVVSAQSVDNLAPAQPTGVTAAYTGGQTQLQWTANTEPDLNLYNVYRGATADFTPTHGNRIGSPASPTFADNGPAGSFYKLSAVDVNGNESSFALITPQQTTGVEETLPVAFALQGVHPNPARGNGLHVAFALPSGTQARLELLDVSGRRLLTREVGSLGAGRHRVNLIDGRSVPPGLYWVRLVQGANQQRRRLAVIE